MAASCPSWPAVDSHRVGVDYKISQLAPELLYNEVYEDPFRILESFRKRSHKMFVIIVLLAIIQGQIALSEVKELPAPRLLSTSVDDPLRFTVSWAAVDSELKDDPILGYKVHVWETPYVPRVHYKQVNGELIRIAESPRRRKLRLQKTYFKNSTNVIDGADMTTYTQENISVNVTYEVKVQVFTNSRDGPLSEPSRFTLH